MERFAQAMANDLDIDDIIDYINYTSLQPSPIGFNAANASETEEDLYRSVKRYMDSDRRARLYARMRELGKGSLVNLITTARYTQV